MLSRLTLSTAQRRAVEGVVVGGVDVAEVAHVGRHRLVVPAAAAEQEAPLRQQRRRAQEELLDPRLAVRQPVAEEAEVAVEARIGRRPGWCVDGSSAL